MSFDLLGAGTDETRLLVHPGCGYSVAISGHPAIAERDRRVSTPGYDAVVTYADLPIEHGIRLDEMPAGMAPQPLAEALATAYATTRAAGTVSVAPLVAPLRPVEASASAHYVVRDEPELMELLVVLVRPHADGSWALFHTIRHAFRAVNPVQWFHIRAATLTSQHWDPEAPRTTPPALFPASTFAEPTGKLTFTPDAWAEAQRKATDVGSLGDLLTTVLLETLIELARTDDPPTLGLDAAYMSQLFMRQLARIGPSQAVDALLRNLDQVRTMHDLRAWCWQCIWAIGNRDERGAGQRSTS